MPAHRLLIAKFWPKIQSTIGASKALSTKGSKFNSTNNTTISSTAPEKSVRLSIKPKAKDENNFIPLDDMDDNSDRAMLTKRDTERDSRGWIVATHEVEVTHRNASVVTENANDGKPQDWNKPPMMGREHV